jgi:rare lipoprotein A
MKQKFFILFLFTAVLFFGQKISAQAQGLDIFRQEGIASWYGREFDGRPTASGEIYDSSQLTAAHPNLPFGTMLTVTNRHNNRSVTVRVNDRGPFVAARIIDVSRAAAEQLDMIVTGTAPVTIESIERIVVTTPPVEIVFSQPSAQTPSAAQTQSPSVAQAPVTQASSNTQAPIVTQPAVTQTPPAQAVAAQTASDTQSPVITQPSAQTVTAQTASAQTSASANVQQPVNTAPSQIRLIPENMTIAQNKVYRL